MNNEAPEIIEARADSLAETVEDLKTALVRLRKRHGLTQQDVAQRLGMSQPAVSQLEKYDSNLTLSSLSEYALAVGARLKIEVIDDCAATSATTARSDSFHWGSMRRDLQLGTTVHV